MPCSGSDLEGSPQILTLPSQTHKNQAATQSHDSSGSYRLSGLYYLLQTAYGQQKTLWFALRYGK
jgi:hypothetical protein